MKKIQLIIAASFLMLITAKAQDTITIYPDVDAIIQTCSKPDLENVQYTNYGNSTFMRSWQWTMSGYPHKCYNEEVKRYHQIRHFGPTLLCC